MTASAFVPSAPSAPAPIETTVTAGHTAACAARQVAYDQYFREWPDACPICRASGWMGAGENCFQCTGRSLCAQCGNWFPDDGQPCSVCGWDWMPGPDPLVCDTGCSRGSRIVSLIMWDQASQRWRIPSKL